MQHYTKDELRNLLKVANENDYGHYLMILISFWHGLRASEICLMKRNQIKDGYLTVQRLKGSLKTIQPLVTDSDSLFNEVIALNDYEPYTNGKNSDRLFPEMTRQLFWYYVHKYGKIAGIPEHKCHGHVLKHTCAKLALKGGMAVDTLKQYLGHKSLSSTGAYLKADDEEASTAFKKVMSGNGGL